MAQVLLCWRLAAAGEGQRQRERRRLARQAGLGRATATRRSGDQAARERCFMLENIKEYEIYVIFRLYLEYI